MIPLKKKKMIKFMGQACVLCIVALNTLRLGHVFESALVH